MKERTEIEKIRILLGRWYSGESSTSEEKELRERLLSAGQLPADLEEERAFFSAIEEPDSILPEMPLEYRERIEAALESEMAGERKTAPFKRRIFNRRLWLRSGTGIAACLAVAFAAQQLWDAPDMGMESSGEKVAINISQPVASYDSLPVHSLTLTPSKEMTAKPTTTSSAKSGKTARKIRKVQPQIEIDKSYEDDDSEYLSAAEEERLARSNYRVVRDAEEADDLLNSIFSRMENTMAMESSRISKIELEYDSEVTRLMQTDNVEQYKEPYHDETPL